MNNEKGLTLVELLAVLVITSSVIVLVISIVINTGNSASSQQQESLSIRSMTTALNSITTDVRRFPENVTIQSDELAISADGETIMYSYDAGNSVLLKNGTAFARGVTDFTVVLNGDTLEVTIIDQAAKEWQTQIVLRKGADL
ncbi:type II secretion system protein [Jeotgalibacillus aurantiacus]|uniref:type II secretion system protein n=1 Tax=Jeotgalibacillus aurantiacus TaxID=2763266 RepID=UPI001D09EB08|nr:prepilin-type N-terminal cleavage/methylation domain-containing protein [Jeotgalibacillus aurantiacus]